MNRINIRQRSIGVNFNVNGQASILVWAPLAETAAIRIKPGNTVIALEKKEYGYWELVTDLLKPGDLYKILLNDKEERPDPASLYQPEGVHGYSNAVDLSEFTWDEQNWDNPSLEQYIIYELHTGTFSSESNFEGIKKKLPYLKDLGINAIEVMPVAQFPGNRNWGYDGVLPFAVQDTYGGPVALKELVDSCHAQGIAVILDVVYNHMGPEGNYLRDFGPYFTGKYSIPWGEAINLDDAWCDGVRNYIIENVLMWFRDFHIDALRLDAVHALKDMSAKHILQAIKESVDELTVITGRTYYLIAECDLNDSKYIDPIDKRGFGMDAQWIDEFHHALRVTAGTERDGYYEDFEGIHHLAKAYEDAYVYDGIYSEHRKKLFGGKAIDNPGRQFIVFSQNHDQVGNRMLGERSSQLFSFEMQKLLAGTVLFSPYIPMLFMGEEYSEPNPFLYFVSHTDPDLADMVRKGRKKEFAAFHLQGEAPDPMAEGTFENSRLQWDLLQRDPHKKMLLYYQSLISLRKKLKSINRLDRKRLKLTYSADDKTMVLYRWSDNEKVICFLNFADVKRSVKVPSHQKTWKKIVDSASPEWDGPQAAAFDISADESILLPPTSFIVYV